MGSISWIRPRLGVELTALDLIGYTLESTVPAPSTVVLSASLLGAMLLLRRKLRKA